MYIFTKTLDLKNIQPPGRLSGCCEILSSNSMTCYLSWSHNSYPLCEMMKRPLFNSDTNLLLYSTETRKNEFQIRSCIPSTERWQHWQVRHDFNWLSINRPTQATNSNDQPNPLTIQPKSRDKLTDTDKLCTERSDPASSCWQLTKLSSGQIDIVTGAMLAIKDPARTEFKKM